MYIFVKMFSLYNVMIFQRIICLSNLWLTLTELLAGGNYQLLRISRVLSALKIAMMSSID